MVVGILLFVIAGDRTPVTAIAAIKLAISSVLLG
jgi:hypothetical protein